MTTAAWLVLAGLGVLILFGTSSSQRSLLASRTFEINGTVCSDTPDATDSLSFASGETRTYTFARLSYPAARWTVSSNPNVGCGGLSVNGCTGTGCESCVNGLFTYNLNSTTPASGIEMEITASVATSVVVRFYPCGAASGGQSQCSTLNSITCADATHIRTCVVNGTGPQLIWSAPSPCSAGQECAGGRCSAAPTTCYVCQGEQALAVPFSSATNTSGQSCEGHVTAAGQTMHTYQPRCVAGQAARDLAYFKPRVIGFRVQAHTPDGRSTGEWSPEFAPDTPVPDVYVKTWRADKLVDVLIHIRNDGDGVASYASGEYYAGQNRVITWLNEAAAGTTHLRNVPGLGTVYEFVELAASGFDAKRLSERNQAYIDAVPWLQTGIVEIAFYGNDAAPYAYTSYYAPRSASRAAWLPLVGEDTSHDIDPCFPNQGPGGDGFVNQFKTLIMSPIDGDCLPYESDSGDEGGACDLLIAGRIKLPYNESAYLDPHRIVPVWDRDGKYWLSGAIFDRCDAVGAPTTYIDVGGSPFDLRSLTPGGEVCCGIPRYNVWGWYFGYAYVPRTQAQCTNVAGSKVLSVNSTRCEPTVLDAGHCYRCDTTGTTRLLDSRYALLEGCRSAQARTAGWTTDLTQALDAGCQQVDLTNMCEQCDANAPVEYLPANTVCTDGWYRSADELQRNCYERCNGVSCDGDTQECLDNARCVEEDPTGVQCGGPCPPEERCLKHPDRGWTCHPVAHPPQKVPCYRCIGTVPYYEDIGATNYPRLQGGDAPVNATASCRQANAIPWAAIAINHVCDSEDNFAYRTIVNPTDETKFCIQHPKTSDIDSCAIWTTDRKRSLDVADIGMMDDVKIEAAKIKVPLATDLAERFINALSLGVAGSNSLTWHTRILAIQDPVCLPDMGDAQCSNSSRCVAAINSPYPEVHKNKVVYDVLKPKLLSGWQTLFLEKSIEEQFVEKHGICLNDRELSWWDRLKRWLANLFGFDPDDPAVTWILVGLGVVGALLLYQAFFKPKRAPNILPYPLAPPQLPSRPPPRRPSYRPIRPRVPGRRRLSR